MTWVLDRGCGPIELGNDHKISDKLLYSDNSTTLQLPRHAVKVNCVSDAMQGVSYQVVKSMGFAPSCSVI